MREDGDAPAASEEAKAGHVLPRTHTLIAYAIVTVLVLLTVVILPASGTISVDPLPVNSGGVTEGTVVSVLETSEQTTQIGTVHNQLLLVRSGGQEVEVQHGYVEGSANGFQLSEGDGVLLVENVGANGQTVYTIRDQERRSSIWLLSLGFALLVVLVGGRQGGLSLVALAVSFLVIVRFVVPAIYSGWDPVLTAILGSLVIMTAALVIGHGPSRKTWIALAGTAVSLGLTGLLAAFAVSLTRLTGYGDEDAATFGTLTGGLVDPAGLLLAGIIIGALGVLDDVTTTQASTVMELRRANNQLKPWDLFLRAMNVGRDHIAATTNTLVLAYAGASLPLLMILAGQSVTLGILVSYEQLATEVVRTLVGSMGIVAAVPVTTALAALVVSREPVVEPPEF